jgi:hypothetical protein
VTGRWRLPPQAARAARLAGAAAGGALLAALSAGGIVLAAQRWLGLGANGRQHGAARPAVLPPRPRQEPPVFNVRGATGILLAAVTLFALGLMVVAGAEALSADHAAEGFEAAAPPPLPPQAELLEGYGWVDRSAGTVRLPIERAMQLLLERGLPTRPEGEQDGFRDAGLGGPNDANGGRGP